MKLQQVLQLLIVLKLVLLFLAGCGGLATTPVAEDPVTTFTPDPLAATPTPEPLTATSTSIPPTVIPTPVSSTAPPLSSPTQAMSEVEKYYPHRINEVRWYVVTSVDSGEVLDLTSFAGLGTEKLADGTTVYVTENTVGYGQASSFDYEEVRADQILLRRYVSKPPMNASDMTFMPPIPLLRSPLEVGRKWNVESQVSNIGPVSITYEVTSREGISVGDKDYQDCVMILKTQDGQPNYRSVYCSDVGVVVFEYPSDTGWIRGELLEVTTARIVLEEVAKIQDDCAYNLKGVGFSDEERMTVMIHSPDGNSYKALEGVPATITVVHTVTPQDPTGSWLVEFIGDKHTAQFVFHWTGQC